MSTVRSKGPGIWTSLLWLAFLVGSGAAPVTADEQIRAEPLPEQREVPVLLNKGVEWTHRLAASVGYVWAAEVENPNDVPTVAVVMLRLHDAAGTAIFEDRREIPLPPGEVVEFTKEGEIPEEVAVRGDHWSFDVAIKVTPSPVPNRAERLAETPEPVSPSGAEINQQTSPSLQATLDSGEVASDVLPSVVLVRARAGDGSESQGSGVLVSPDGILITSLHVLSGMTAAGVQLADGERYDEVEVLAMDPRRDLAILKIAGFDLPHAVLGDSNTVAIGEEVLAIGSPLGLDGTVTKGVVSSIRDHEAGFKVLQTDAAANPGNSGGPLVNSKGEVIGIVGFKVSDAENLNFAIPINYARGMLSGTQESMTLQEMNELLTEAKDVFSGDSGFPIRIPIKHRHFAAFRHAILILHADRIEFDETDSSDHDFTVSVDDVAQLNTSSVTSIMGNTSYTLHFVRDTNAGDKISFEVDLASLRTLVDYVVEYCPNAVINR